MVFRQRNNGLFCLVAGLSLAWATNGLAADERQVQFDRDVHPILAEVCYDCHGGGKTKGGLSLESREGILKGGYSGPAVVEGDGASSFLIRVVSGLDPDIQMPPKGAPLTAGEIDTLRDWIDQGLHWEMMEASPKGYVPSLALQPATLPTGDASGNPIDSILRPYFAEHGVVPPEPVSDRRYIRRVYVDIIGLLPTPEAVDRFVADQSEHKRDALVQSLLNDRQGYAEHWMTFWNDALRNDFKGTGYIDGGRKQITSWLYAALHDNLPYDQFVRQLVDPTEESAGFINGIVWRGAVKANERPEMQAARSVSQVFLGVNLKCASCHDSFVDHWTLKDSYGLATVFAEEPMELVRCDVALGETAQAKFLWPELGAIDPDLSVDERRAQLAEILTGENNGFLPRALVNRLWAKFLGRGLVEPLEQLENEPWHPGLLDWLARDLIDNGYDVQATMARILTSEVYQWPSVDSDPEMYVFRGPEARRLSAEQFLDGLSRTTGAWQEGALFDPPSGTTAASSEGVGVRAWRVEADMLARALGRPNREQVMLRRDMSPTTLQSVELSNGAALTAFLQRGAKSLLAASGTDAEVLADRIYQRMLQRTPNQTELATAVGILGNPVTQSGTEDLIWAIALLPEFQFIQ